MEIETSMDKTVMALVPHPDDAEWYAGGLLANFRKFDNAKIIIVIATDGCRGSYEYDHSVLVALRQTEACQAADILGAEQPIFLRYHDFELDRLPAGILRENFIRLIRQWRPDVVIAEDPYPPGEPHPDHRAISYAAADAINYAGLPLLHPEHLVEGLKPHFVTEKYYYSESSIGTNKIIDISETMDIKLDALAAHKSQISFMTEGLVRQAQLSGLDLEKISRNMPEDPQQAFNGFFKTQAAEIGKQIGARFAEAFRYERFHPLVESMLSETVK
jgi:N,N'-diacetylchitobiose non-reducing end deacetylase